MKERKRKEMKRKYEDEVIYRMVDEVRKEEPAVYSGT